MNEAEGMVNRILSEEKISTSLAGQIVGANTGGSPIHKSTIVRWCLKGVKLSDGRRVYLDHIRAVGRIVTSREALVRFLAEQSALPTSDTPAIRTPTQRSKASERAAKELEALGI